MILASIAQAAVRKEMVSSFRGSRAHDLAWLRSVYLENGGPALPPDVAKSFARLNPWSTDLQYEAGTVRRRDANAMLEAAAAILEWAEGRL